jgi:hypothetical protein
MLATDLQSLQGRTVLVRSARDRRNPETAVRGTLEVCPPTGADAPRVQIALEFPQMFTTRAHHHTIPLNEAELAQLLASGRDGTFEFVLASPIDPQGGAND